MILNKETIEKFGYDPEKLSYGSYKYVVMKCDYCGCEKDVKFGVRNNGYKSFPKDACKECGPKKRQDSLMEKYGVRSTQEIKEVRNKTRQTCIDKYGTEEFFSSKEIQEKIKKTNIKKYGHEHILKNEDFKNNIKNILIEKYGVDNVFKLRSVQDEIAQNKTRYFKGQTIQELAKSKGIAYTTMCQRIQKFGFEDAIAKDKFESSLETKMKVILDEIGAKYTHQGKVKKYRPDFILENNIIIETDGLYWHSELCQEDDNYHFNKKEEYNKEGYSSYFFREDELRDKPEIVKSIILNALNRSNKIFARKTKAVKVSKSQASLFLQKNHLMGNGKGECFGLEHNGELVSLIRINRTSEGCYDVSRFCHKLNTNVIGGFSKLLKFVEKEIKMNTLSTFIDRRYGKGFYLHEFGFHPTSLYKSFKWTNGEESFHRLKFSNQSGYESGLVKIWDCGQHKFIKKY